MMKCIRRKPLPADVNIAQMSDVAGYSVTAFDSTLHVK